MKHKLFIVLDRKWLKVLLTKETMMMMLWDSVRSCDGFNSLYILYM